MQRLCMCCFFYFCIFLLPIPRTNAQDSPATASTYAPADVPNSVAGFQAQVDELVRVGKMHDQAMWNIALDTFALPKPGTWFETNFAVQHVAQLSQDYPKVRDLIHGRTVQGMAFQHDQKGGGIVGVVQLQIKVERDGHVSKIKVLSGDDEFVEDAKIYAKTAQFPAMPNIPQLANAERKWEFEIAFSNPRTNTSVSIIRKCRRQLPPAFSLLTI